MGHGFKVKEILNTVTICHLWTENSVTKMKNCCEPATLFLALTYLYCKQESMTSCGALAISAILLPEQQVVKVTL